MTPGLKLSTILYAGGLAVVSAAMLSLLPALKVTRARVQPHLANLGTGGATLRFGRVWTGAMIVQVALTAIGIPVALESASQTMRKLQHPRSSFQVGSISPLASMWTGRSRRRPRRRSRSGGRRRSRSSQRRIAQEPGVVAVTFADRAPGTGSRTRFAEVESSPGAEPAYDDRISDVGGGPGILRGVRSADCRRACLPRRRLESQPRERSSSTRRSRARFRARREAGRRSALASGMPRRQRDATRQPPPTRRRTRGSRSWASCATSAWTLTTTGDEQPYVFHAASAGTLSPLVMSVRMRGNPAPLAARLPVIAATVDARIARPGRAAAGRMGPAAR